MNQSLVENNARMFAAITNEANMIVPLLTQSFDIRIKNNQKSFDVLYGMGIPAADCVKMLGKTFNAKVDWSCMEMFVPKLEGINWCIMLHPSTFKDCVTQIGIAPKMYKTWKLAADNQ